MKKLRFQCEMKKGEFFVNEKLFKDFTKNLPDGKYSVEINKWYKKRSKTQNRWYWEVLKIIGDELGYEPDELHYSFRHKFLNEMVDGLSVPRSTTSLTTIEMNEYWERIYQWAAEKEIFIPDPESYN